MGRQLTDMQRPISRRQALINIAGTVAAGVGVATGAAYVAFAPRQQLPASASQRAPFSPGDSVGLFRPSDSTFYLVSSFMRQRADVHVTIPGLTGLPVAGDWAGNGIDAVGIFTPESGMFHLLAVNKTGAAVAHTVALGRSGDIPVAGDWKGAGHDGIGVYRPSEGSFYLKSSLDNAPPDIVISMGAAGDMPVAGDWNGDGIDGVGVYRPSQDTFFLSDSACSSCAATTDYSVSLGVGAGLPLAGNWLAQGRFGVGIFLPSASMMFLRNDPTQSGPPDYHMAVGLPGDLPVAGHWVRFAPPQPTPTS